MQLLDVIITMNKEIKKNNFLLKFNSKEIASETRMGQFLELKIGDGTNNLLRKPISINDVEGDEISILYRVVGKGTKGLSLYKPGDKISVIGPLGNGFPDIASDKEVLIVAGGIGCGPFGLVMRNIKEWKLFYGFRDVCEFLMEDAIKLHQEQNKAFITTDNGSYGKQGFVTEELEKYLINDSKNKVIFACGPEIMMKKVSKIARLYNVESYLSLEEYMGCGIGACVGCVQKIKNSEKENGWEYKKVCKDGPVFRGEEVIWDES